MISTITNRSVYSPSGSTTVFAIPFYFLDNSHIQVIVTDEDGVATTKVIDTDYTLTGVGVEAGGELTMLVAPVLGDTLSISRVVPITQLVDYIPNTSFPAATHEAALDKLTMISQYLEDLLQRSLKYPVSETNTDNYELPASGERLSTLVGFDSSGNLYLYSIDPDALELIAPVAINTADIVNGAVTAAKLATSLDLTGKTIVYPLTSVLATHLANSLDLSAKSIVLPNLCVSPESHRIKSIVSTIMQEHLRLEKLVLNLPDVGFSISGSSTAAVNQTYAKLDTYLGKNRYAGVTTSTIQVRWNNASWRWEIYNTGSATLIAHGNNSTSYGYLHEMEHPMDHIDWIIDSGTGTPIFVLDSEQLEVSGNIKGTAFIGSASGLTDIPIDPYSAIAALPTTTGGGQRTSDRANFYINSNGEVLSCGLNTSGKLGIGYTSPSQVAFPRKCCFQVGTDAINGVTDNLNDGTDTIVKLFLRDNNAYALSAAGILYGCGVNDSGQLGQGDTTDRVVFKSIRFGASAATNKAITSFSVADGSDNNTPHCLAIDVDGQVWVWGENSHGQLGINSTTDATTPVKLSTSGATNAATFVGKVAIQVLAITGQKGSSFILFNDGTAYATGHNQYGVLGQGNTTQLQNFAIMGAFNTIEELYGSGFWSSGSGNSFGTMFVRLADDTIYGCGYNGNGELGVGDTTLRNSLTVVTGLGAVSQFRLCGDSAKWCFAVKSSDGTIKAWGDNALGQLGDGSTTDRTSFVSPTGIDAIVTAAGGVTKIIGTGAITSCQTFILLANGMVYGCGGNANAQLGLGHATTPQTTFQKTSLGHPTNVNIEPCSQDNLANCLAHRSNNTVYSCGYNASQHISLGDADTNDLRVAQKIRV